MRNQGRTWGQRIAALEAVRAGKRVLYCDAEGSALVEIVRRRVVLRHIDSNLVRVPAGWP